MNSEKFEGKVGQMKTKSIWLASEDFIGLKEPIVTIESVRRHTDVPMEGGRKEKELFAVHFTKTTKGLILNATNRKALASAYGADTKKWIGQQVQLYVQTGVRKPGGAQGETTTGLRIRPVVSNPLLGGDSV